METAVFIERRLYTTLPATPPHWFFVPPYLLARPVPTPKNPRSFFADGLKVDVVNKGAEVAVVGLASTGTAL